MNDIYTTSPVSYINNTHQINEVHEICHPRQQVPCKLAKGSEAKTLFGMNLPQNNVLLREFHPFSGTLNPIKFIEKMQLGVRQFNNEIWYQHQVKKISRKDEHYVIELTDFSNHHNKIIQAGKIVLAAGPYNPFLLTSIASYFQSLIIPKRVSVSFFKIDEECYHQYSDEQKKRIADSLPIFSQLDLQFYAMIDHFDENGVPVIKAGLHLDRASIDYLDKVWHQPLSEDEIDQTKTALFNYLSLLDLSLTKADLIFCQSQVCVYSETSNEIPYVTNLIDRETLRLDSNAVVIGGMSGIGAKGCLAYGLLAANLLLGKQEDGDLYQLTQQQLGSDRLMKELVKQKLG